MCDYCSWIDQILARIKIEVKEEKKRPLHVNPTIVVHGGAGKIPRKAREFMLQEVKNAAIAAYSDLIRGRSAMDAVERAVSYMECIPCFNCAKGGSLDVNNEIVMDAAIANASKAGCVGAVRNIEHPIKLARKVLEKTEHILIVEDGAQKFALQEGFEILPPNYLNVKCEYLPSEYSLLKDGEWGESVSGTDRESVLNYGEFVESGWENMIEDTENRGQRDVCRSDCVIPRLYEDTCPFYPASTDSKSSSLSEPTVFQAGAVGVVAYDRKKRLASGTSTAGEPSKPIGCVSAIGTVIGCGIYTNESAAVSVSGDDSNIYYYAPARKIAEKLSENVPMDCALTIELANFVEKTGEFRIGAIALNAKGDPSISFKCMHFPWAYCRNGYVYYGCAKNEKFLEEVPLLERPLDCMCEGSNESL